MDYKKNYISFMEFLSRCYLDPEILDQDRLLISEFVFLYIIEYL